jgi:hypothetical protein
VQLEQKGPARFQSGKIPAARNPEIDFVRTEPLEKVKPIVVGYTNIETHIAFVSVVFQIAIWQAILQLNARVGAKFDRRMACGDGDPAPPSIPGPAELHKFRDGGGESFQLQHFRAG